MINMDLKMYLNWLIINTLLSTINNYVLINNNFKSIISGIIEIANKYKSQVIFSTHPRTRKKLESLNIGRPSTYSSIIESIMNKKYVLKGNIEGKKTKVRQLVFVFFYHQ